MAVPTDKIVAGADFKFTGNLKDIKDLSVISLVGAISVTFFFRVNEGAWVSNVATVIDAANGKAEFTVLAAFLVAALDGTSGTIQWEWHAVLSDSTPIKSLDSYRAPIRPVAVLAA